MHAWHCQSPAVYSQGRAWPWLYTKIHHALWSSAAHCWAAQPGTHYHRDRLGCPRGSAVGGWASGGRVRVARKVGVGALLSSPPAIRRPRRRRPRAAAAPTPAPVQAPPCQSSAGPRPGAATLWARRWGRRQGKRAAGPSLGARSCQGLARRGPDQCADWQLWSSHRRTFVRCCWDPPLADPYWRRAGHQASESQANSRLDPRCSPRWWWRRARWRCGVNILNFATRRRYGAHRAFTFIKAFVAWKPWNASAQWLSHGALENHRQRVRAAAAATASAQRARRAR